jgi:succinate-acetate transporter protein
MSESLKRAVRTAVQTFVGVFALSLTGLLNSVIDWASGESDVSSVSVVGKAAVAGAAAAFVGLVSWAQNAAETKEWWPGWFRDTAHGRAIRTAVQTFVGVFALGLTTWLQSISDWASTGGDVPDVSVLGKAAVAGFAAAVVGLVSYVQNALEDNTSWPNMLKAADADG